MCCFFNDTATTEIYTLSLHDALPICSLSCSSVKSTSRRPASASIVITSPSRTAASGPPRAASGRSEEHTSELQSRQYLVCRLLLEKKKKKLHAWHAFLAHLELLSPRH